MNPWRPGITLRVEGGTGANLLARIAPVEQMVRSSAVRAAVEFRGDAHRLPQRRSPINEFALASEAILDSVPVIRNC